MNLLSRHLKTGRDVVLGSFDTLPDQLAKSVRLAAQHDACFDIGRRGAFGVIEERQDGDEDGFGSLRGGPALGGGFSGHLVFAGGMKDGDADFALCVDVGVVDRLLEFELWARLCEFGELTKKKRRRLEAVLLGGE